MLQYCKFCNECCNSNAVANSTRNKGPWGCGWRDTKVIIPFNFQGKVKSASPILNFSGKNIPYFILKMLQLLNSEMVIFKVTHIMKAGNPPLLHTQPNPSAATHSRYPTRAFLPHTFRSLTVTLLENINKCKYILNIQHIIRTSLLHLSWYYSSPI